MVIHLFHDHTLLKKLRTINVFWQKYILKTLLYVHGALQKTAKNIQDIIVLRMGRYVPHIGILVTLSKNVMVKLFFLQFVYFF
jgi:hypothetical protein